MTFLNQSLISRYFLRSFLIATFFEAALATVLGTLNVIGGFVVTDRMLEMFKKKPKV